MLPRHGRMACRLLSDIEEPAIFTRDGQEETRVDRVRHSNKVRVLETIRKSEPVARTEIAEITGLAHSTISSIVQELVDGFFVTEKKQKSEGKGRPRISLGMNRDAGAVAGVFLFPDGRMDVRLSNMAGETLFSGSCVIRPDDQPDLLADAMAHHLSEIFSQCGQQDIFAIGISIAALIDAAAGVIHWMPPGAPAPIPFAAMLEERLGRRVYIDNVANIIARSLRWSEREEQPEDFITIIIGPGIAMARFTEGIIRNGARGFNSEIGHVKVATAPEANCICGRKGCLFAVASFTGLARRAAQDDTLSARHAVAGFNALKQAASNGDGHALSLFSQAGEAMGIAISNIINLSDPGRILIATEDEEWFRFAGPALREYTVANSILPLQPYVDLSFSLLNPDHYVTGTISMVFDRMLMARENVG